MYHDIRVEEDTFEERLGIAGQLGDQGCQPQVDSQSIISKARNPAIEINYIRID